MLEIPRGRDGREALRFRFVRARTPDGKEVAWHDLREFFKGDDGAWHPGKKGITVRGKELHAVTIAFLRAVASSVPPALHASARAIVAALGGTPPASGTQTTSAARAPAPTATRVTASEQLDGPTDEECGF